MPLVINRNKQHIYNRVLVIVDLNRHYYLLWLLYFYICTLFWNCGIEGYLHEHSRKDRDQFVKINWDNIKPGKDHNFRKCEGCDSQGLPYDTGSVMQYHENAFSNGNGPTIESLDGSQLGQRDGFSASDIEGINKIYCGELHGI